MVNLYDLVMNAHGGRGSEDLARRFGISPEQTQAAVAALMPAFAQGVQRAMSSPQALTGMMQTMNPMAFAQAYDGQAHAGSPQNPAGGVDALAALFGSKDVSRAVADQAARASGVSGEMMRQMLPSVATLVIGGLIKSFLGGMGQGSAPSPGASGNRMGGTATDPFGGMLGQVMKGMFGGGAGPASAQPGSGGPASSAPADPFGGVLDAWMKGMTGGMGGSRESAEPPHPGGEADQGTAAGSGPARSPFDMWQNQIEAGRQVSEDYNKSISDIFDGFFGPKRS